jgi:hypothetical protein
MNRRRMQFAAAGVIAMLLDFMPVAVNAQMSKVKTVWVIPMENHNWTSNNTGAAFGAPDIKGGPKAPYINSVLANTAAFAEQYYSPRGNLNFQGAPADVGAPGPAPDQGRSLAAAKIYYYAAKT